MNCPVCGNSAEKGRETGRDGEQFRCPRCGPYFATRTALSMLRSRVVDDPRAGARASHAIRTITGEDQWLEINSTDVDRLISSPLPPVERQIDFLLRWLSAQVDDDRLGWAQLPDNPERLAGVVGAVDGKRVIDLMSFAHSDGLIETRGRNVRLSLKGWRRLEASEPSPREGPMPAEAPKSALASSEVRKAHCPVCGPNRNAEIMASHVERQDDEHGMTFTIDAYRVLRCRGCSEVFVQREHRFSENEEIEVDPDTGHYETVLVPTFTYWPAPTRRKPPAWADRITDPVVSNLVDEIYEALNADLRSLAAMGIRALLDKTFDLAGATPGDSFAGKLTALEAKGAISPREKEILLVMTDAGSAASHRGWQPEPEELASILDAAESLLHSVVVLEGAAADLKKRVPPRPKRG